eukprot:jgi/Ulvmu1/6266/UM028_0124.1
MQAAATMRMWFNAGLISIVCVLVALDASYAQPEGAVALPPASLDAVEPTGVELEDALAGTTPGTLATESGNADPLVALDTELRGIMKECAIFMGNQQPSEPSQDKDDEEIEAENGETCRKQRGRLPIVWDPERNNTSSGNSKWVTDAECYASADNQEFEASVMTTLSSCIAECTVARRCNFITFTPPTGQGSLGTCTSFHIDLDCFDNGGARCYDTIESGGTVGFSLGDCPFAAQPSGGIFSQSFKLFRAMRQDAANALAIAASAITILMAVAGAPFSFLSKVFKQ